MLDADDDWEPGPALDEDEAGSVRAPAAAGEEEPPRPVYADLETWLHKHLAQIIRRRFGGSLTWCSQWYRHAEAISRLNAMWQEWEKAVAEGTMSNWWLYHCDPHLSVLMSKDSGPFMACKPGEHRQLDSLPLADSDPLLWLGSAFSDPAADPSDGERQASAGDPEPAAQGETPPGGRTASL
ncbi:DUF4913 domain-containing protein [Streptomyces sp. NPDC052396]|uniref:DUF4913 domain-containing protein n=1 Tax=Streptomyces sp. NPDC052396 TaxID=3365689 RepID=UPI0037CD38B3